MAADAMEASLSRLVGDIAAHRIGSGVAALQQWRNQSGRRIVENVSEYLGDEVGLLVSRRDLDILAADLAHIYKDLARLDARISSITTKEDAPS